MGKIKRYLVHINIIADNNTTIHEEYFVYAGSKRQAKKIVKELAIDGGWRRYETDFGYKDISVPYITKAPFHRTRAKEMELPW